MKQETEPIQRPSKEQEITNMDDALAEMQRLRRIHFSKSLPKSAIPKGELGKYAELTLPAQFVQENCHKIEEWVILRTQLSSGKVSRPWLVRLRVSNTTAKVRIYLGWHSFVTDNHLKQGDSLIFLLKEEATSEFEVHMFRGPQGRPYFPDDGEDSPIEADGQDFDSASEDESYSPSLEHHEVELNNFRNGKVAQFRNTKPLEKLRTFPGFCKRLTASCIRRSDGDSYSGQFVSFSRGNLKFSIQTAMQMRLPTGNAALIIPLQDFPWSFVKTHGNQLNGSVQLQGIHEDSPTYLVTCRRRPQHGLRVSFVSSEWSRFVMENGLKNGHKLQFSLVDEAYFVVRKV